MGASYDKTSQDKFQTAAGNAGIKSAKIGRSTAYLSDHRAEIVVQKKQVEALEKQSGLSTVQKKSNATGLPDQLKSGIENLSGHSMDDVKVHFNSAKPAQLNAHAFAQGNQIHIASGQEKHLPHEAWHVVQQKQGRVNPTMQMKGKVSVNDDKGLEHEADVMGAKALQFSKGSSDKSKLTTTSNTNNSVQRKVGVEYETTWGIMGDNHKQNHKQTVYSGSGWHMESDNNNLEFVVFPPANSPEQLEGTVDHMSKLAEKIKANRGNFATHDVKTILGSKVAPAFEKQKFVAGADADMSAKAQFSFGISMENLTKLFDGLTAGLPTGNAKTKDEKFNFARPNIALNNDTTTHDFLTNTVSADVKKSKDYRAGMKELEGASSPKMQGFLAYLGYTIKAMEANYGKEFSNRGHQFTDGTTDKNKAALFAQEIVKRKGAAETLGQVAISLGYTTAMVNVLDHGIFGDFMEGSGLNHNTLLSELKPKIYRKLEKYKEKRTKVGMDYPKYRFTFMNRTGFDKMYQNLSAADQKWFRDNIDQVIAKIGRTPNSPLFASPYSYKTKKDENDVHTKTKGFSHGPTLKGWLQSIVKSTPQKRDLLSPPKEFIMGNGKQDTDQSLGLLAKMDTSEVTQHVPDPAKPQRLKLETKKVKQVIIELRSWGDYIKPEHWAAHSHDMAYLFSEIAKGDLTQEKQVKDDTAYNLELNTLLTKKETLNAGIVKKFSDHRGRKNNEKNQNTNLRGKIAVVDKEISLLKQKYKK